MSTVGNLSVTNNMFMNTTTSATSWTWTGVTPTTVWTVGAGGGGVGDATSYTVSTGTVGAGGGGGGAGAGVGSVAGNTLTVGADYNGHQQASSAFVYPSSITIQQTDTFYTGGHYQFVTDERLEQIRAELREEVRAELLRELFGDGVPVHATRRIRLRDDN